MIIQVFTIFLFGVNVGCGYFAMLVFLIFYSIGLQNHTVKVAMTYSGELFMCMVMGLLLGHGIFNTSK